MIKRGQYTSSYHLFTRDKAILIYLFVFVIGSDAALLYTNHCFAFSCCWAGAAGLGGGGIYDYCEG